MPSKESNWDCFRIVITMSARGLKKAERIRVSFLLKRKKTHTTLLYWRPHTPHLSSACPVGRRRPTFLTGISRGWATGRREDALEVTRPPWPRAQDPPGLDIRQGFLTGKQERSHLNCDKFSYVPGCSFNFFFFFNTKHEKKQKIIKHKACLGNTDLKQP